MTTSGAHRRERIQVVPATVRRFGQHVAEEGDHLRRGAVRLAAAALDPADFGRYERSGEVADSYARALDHVVGLHHTGAQVLAQLSSLLQHQVPRRVRDQDAAGALALEELTRRLRADLTGRRP